MAQSQTVTSKPKKRKAQKGPAKKVSQKYYQKNKAEIKKKQALYRKKNAGKIAKRK